MERDGAIEVTLQARDHCDRPEYAVSQYQWCSRWHVDVVVRGLNELTVRSPKASAGIVFVDLSAVRANNFDHVPKFPREDMHAPFKSGGNWATCPNVNIEAAVGIVVEVVHRMTPLCLPDSRRIR